MAIISNSRSGVSVEIPPYSEAISDFRIKAILSRSLSLQKAEIRFLAPFGDVMLINGTSSCGKSSIIAEMKACSPELEEIGSDLLEYEMTINYIRNRHPETFELLDAALIPQHKGLHIINAVRAGVFHFKEGILEEMRIEADRRALEISKDVIRAMRFSPEEKDHGVLEKVKACAASHIPSVFDILAVDRVKEHSLCRLPVRKVLVYCPLEVLLDRIQKRNREALEEGKPNELRVLGEVPLLQIAEIFRPALSVEDRVFFTLTKRQIVDAFTELIDELETFSMRPPLARMSEAERAERLDRVLSMLGFEDPTIAFLQYTSKYKGYDHIIDTSLLDASSAAASLGGGEE